ncbi:MAG: hypothetical protein HYV16_07625 [Gammaproteobacteria bacterium]|nr:hypothetical protein [Gammaproteobacteria bacterium]
MHLFYRLFLLCCVILLAACTPKEKILDLPDAENMLFTPEGRLIVSGKGIYEILRDNGSYRAVSLYDGDCAFAGIAQRGDWLYSVCAGGPIWAMKRYLLAAELKPDQSPHFQILREIDLVIPNGMAFDRQGVLFLADENFFGAGKIVRVEIADGDPPRVLRIDSWLDGRHGVKHPNGVRVVGDELYFTDGGAVKVFRFDDFGNVLGSRELYQRTTVFDDLLPACGGAVVADYIAGTVLYVDRNGVKQYESTPQSFPGASSMQIGRPPLFATNQLLITEKGMLLETDSTLGDKLVRIDAGFDLAAYAANCPQ